MLDIQNLQPGLFLVAVAGRLDASEVGRARAQLDNLARQNPHGVVMDMEKTFLLDSTGLTLLVQFHQRMKTNQGRIIFCAVPDKILELFRITRLHQVFSFCLDRDEAIRKLTSPA